MYPGDGYGGVNIDRRHQLHLPSNAPAPDTISQIVSAGDATGDGKTDFFLTVGDALWAFVGYNGATIEQAVQLSGSAWLDRDIVTAQDVTGDQVADLVYRSESGRLLLRTGKKAATGEWNSPRSPRPPIPPRGSTISTVPAAGRAPAFAC